MCKLRTETTVIAATNPKIKYDRDQSTYGSHDSSEWLILIKGLSVNTALASPLLSRFDLILVLLDDQNNDWDRVVSHFILKGVRNHVRHGAAVHTLMQQATTVKEEVDDNCWSMNKLQAYISHVGKTFFPVLNPDAERVLMTYYKKQRMLDSRNAGGWFWHSLLLFHRDRAIEVITHFFLPPPARTTIRLLESLIRLAQGEHQGHG